MKASPTMDVWNIGELIFRCVYHLAVPARVIDIRVLCQESQNSSEISLKLSHDRRHRAYMSAADLAATLLATYTCTFLLIVQLASSQMATRLLAELAAGLFILYLAHFVFTCMCVCTHVGQCIQEKSVFTCIQNKCGKLCTSLCLLRNAVHDTIQLTLQPVSLF